MEGCYAVYFLGRCDFYLVVATVFSGAFRQGYFDFYNSDEIPFLLAFAAGALVIALGPTVAAVLSWALFGPQYRSSTFQGTWSLGAILMLITPPLVLAGFGYSQEGVDMNPHLFGAAMGTIIVLYALGEEIGWRGYLQDALTPLPFIQRAFIVGTGWWAWHLWFLEDSNSATQLAVTYGILLATSFIFSWIISTTKSWVSAAAFHSLGNIAFFAGSLALPQDERFLIAGVAFAILLALHTLWMRLYPVPAQTATA